MKENFSVVFSKYSCVK